MVSVMGKVSVASSRVLANLALGCRNRRWFKSEACSDEGLSLLRVSPASSLFSYQIRVREGEGGTLGCEHMAHRTKGSSPGMSAKPQAEQSWQIEFLHLNLIAEGRCGKGKSLLKASILGECKYNRNNITLNTQEQTAKVLPVFEVRSVTSGTES
ncbi:hypothetical protein MHYP_G00119180 [Metynnis hypsauchen]